MDIINDIVDFIVVGSGPAAVQCAQTLLDGGAAVLMVDSGLEGKQAPVDTGNFETLRQNWPDQNELWLGKELEGLSFSEIETGSQLTPPRRHLMAGVKDWTPLLSATFQPMESLARGGLGGAWGLGCCAFSDAELEMAKLPVAEMRPAYATIADRIGISYSPDDIEVYTRNGNFESQPAIEIDGNARHTRKKYQQHKTELNKKGFYLGRPALALLTQDKADRKATQYEELDFYTNENQSAWRPEVTLAKLEAHPRFDYLKGILVTSFLDDGQEVVAEGIGMAAKNTVRIRGRRLVLAAGVLGTARIVLRSFGRFGQQLPLLCNPYAYVPCLQWAMLGRPYEGKRTATAQLSLFHDPDGRNINVAMASLYSYRSLMMFRVIRQAPLGFKEARKFMQYLLPAITIAGIHQPDAPHELKYLKLNKDPGQFTGDLLAAHYGGSDEAGLKMRLKLFTGALKKMGCYPLKLIEPGAGSSIHYAGSLPYSTEEKPLHLLQNGRLGQTRNVYVADASGLGYLPAKGITLSLMANAHRTALNALTHV